MPFDLNALLTGTVSAVTVLVFVVLGLISGKLVPGWAYAELKERNRRLEDAAERALLLAQGRGEARGGGAGA